MNHRIFSASFVLRCSLCAVALMVAGCSLKKQSPAKLRYMLEAKRPGEPSAGSGLPVLRVRNFQVAAPFEGQGFVYRNAEQNYETDFYHEFLVAPQSMLTEQVRQWLEASGRFRAVLGPASRLDAAYSLEANVTALYADFRDKAAPKAVLEIHFLLANEGGVASHIAFQKAYRQEVLAETRSPEALAKAWSAGLAKILADLERDLAGAGAR